MLVIGYNVRHDRERYSFINASHTKNYFYLWSSYPVAIAPVEYSTNNMIELKQKIIYTTLNLSKINFFSSGMLWGVQRRSNSDTEI